MNGVCFHCELPIPDGVDLRVEVEGSARRVCCAGCQAVTESIFALGLDAYYAHRERAAARVETGSGDLAPELLDDPQILAEYAHREPDGSWSALFSVEGLRCAACAWLIERGLLRCDGVKSAGVHLAGGRVRVEWDAARTRPSRILKALESLGYRGRPFEPGAHASLLEAERRSSLVRLGITLLCTMQVMSLGLALHAGALQGIEPAFRDFFRLASLPVTGIVLVVAARDYFLGALRDLRRRALGMDVPVALGLAAAFLGSAWASLSGSGEVYFDSVCMFAFLLGLGRHFELRARQSCDAQLRRAHARLPSLAWRLAPGASAAETATCVPVRLLVPGDHVLVRPGSEIPADGIVVEGESAVAEALLSGEPEPLSKRPGDRVLGGSHNTASPLVIELTHRASEGRLAMIGALLDRAQFERPAIAGLADRIASRFVARVLLLSALSFAAWWVYDPARAFWVALSVLVVSCPCALSLATPTALAAATSALAARGLLITRGHTLESLASADAVVFDKTGTLSTGELHVAALWLGRSFDPQRAWTLAAALERRSEHPIAHAILRAAAEAGALELAQRIAVDDFVSVPGCGVEAQVDGQRLRLGRPDWVHALASAETSDVEVKRARVALGDEKGTIAALQFVETVRPGARELVAWLLGHGRDVHLVSGDPSESSVAAFAAELGIASFVSGASPEEKIARLAALRGAGRRVAAIGDGVNDAPLLGSAEVSVAMGSGTDLARVAADAVLLGESLTPLCVGFAHADATRRVIRQNLTWAFVYNVLALPLAMLGWVPPYAAALGMAASSLGVVANALRLSRIGERA